MCNLQRETFVIRNSSISQLSIMQIKLLIAIWVIGHFLYIRMYSIESGYSHHGTPRYITNTKPAPTPNSHT